MSNSSFLKTLKSAKASAKGLSKGSVRSTKIKVSDPTSEMQLHLANYYGWLLHDMKMLERFAFIARCEDATIDGEDYLSGYWKKAQKKLLGKVLKYDLTEYMKSVFKDKEFKKKSMGTGFNSESLIFLCQEAYKAMTASSSRGTASPFYGAYKKDNKYDFKNAGVYFVDFLAKNGHFNLIAENRSKNTDVKYMSLELVSLGLKSNDAKHEEYIKHTKELEENIKKNSSGLESAIKMIADWNAKYEMFEHKTSDGTLHEWNADAVGRFIKRVVKPILSKEGTKFLDRYDEKMGPGYDYNAVKELCEDPILSAFKKKNRKS